MSAFKKSFPDVSLEYQPGEFVSMLPKLQAEMAKGKASIDIVIGGSQPLQHKEVLAPLNERIIVPDAIDPAKWQSSFGKGLKFNDREQKFVLQTSEWVSGYVLVNSRNVDPATITSWKDLLKPQWKGKIASHDPRGAGTGQSVASYLLVSLATIIVDLYKGQRVVLTRDYAQVADWVAQGKYGVDELQTRSKNSEGKNSSKGVRLRTLRVSERWLRYGRCSGCTQQPTRQQFLNWFLNREGRLAFQKPLVYPSALMFPGFRAGLHDSAGLEYADTYGRLHPHAAKPQRKSETCWALTTLLTDTDR
jgi:hypothetical protein